MGSSVSASLRDASDGLDFVYLFEFATDGANVLDIMYLEINLALEDAIVSLDSKAVNIDVQLLGENRGYV